LAVSFYRLKITDKDGSFAHSKLVMIKSETIVKAELIGNPFTSTINVAIHNTGSERIQAELVDMSGKRVSNTTYQHPGGSSVMQIPAQNIGSGNYLLRLNGSEINETLRLVKVQR
jgi:Secretion system C-terminal sorting domain